MHRLVLAFALALAGCASHVELDENRSSAYGGGAALEHARSLGSTVDALVDGSGNLGRERAACERVRELGLARFATKRWIDWWTPSKNIVIDVPAAGADGQEPLVLVVAHYDKADVRPDTLVSRLLLDALDPVLAWSYLSSGAIDDASGCSIVLELAKEVAEHRRPESYRFLLLGCQESGLRGARCYLGGMSRRDARRTRLIVNLDSVGVRDASNGVLESDVHPELVEDAMRIAANHGFSLEKWTLTSPCCGDDEPFANGSVAGDLGFGLFFDGPLGLLPQRSWWGERRALPVVTFSSREAAGVLDLIPGILLPLPLGALHGPRDRPSRVDPWLLYEQYEIVRELTLPKEAPSIVPKPEETPKKPEPPANLEVEAAKLKRSRP